VQPTSLEPGINLCGLFRSENGLGQAARLLAQAVEATGIPYTTRTYTRSASRQGAPWTEHGDGLPAFDVNLLALNGDATVMFAADAGPALFEGRHTIGTWAWETDRIPERWAGSLELVDEVWMPSEFSRQAVAAATDKPTLVFPHPIPIPPAPVMTRADAGLPEAFTFLFAFDFFSGAERKNATGVVRAFRLAFPEPGGAALVIKSANGPSRPADLRRLLEAAAGRPDILVRDGHTPQPRLQAMIGLCDCYVSLHRAEGFGLTIAEAMAQGRPAIATGYSGNLEFMTEENSLLVGHRLVPVGADAAFYSSVGRWADPDLEHAAALMREVFEHREAAAARAARGVEDIRRLHSVEARADLVRRRYTTIRADHLPARRVWGADWGAASPLLRAELRLAREPGLDLPTRSGGLYGAFARLSRRAFRRLHLPYQSHDEEAGRALSEALWEQAAEIRRLRARLEELESRPAAGR
jgi:hypothetical protein